MAAPTESNLQSYLKKLGFVAVSDKKGRLKWTGPTGSAHGEGATSPARKMQSPLRLRKLVIKVEELGWHLEEVIIDADLSQFSRNLVLMAQEQHGHATRVEIGEGTRGELWCFLETVNARAKGGGEETPQGLQSPHGLAGFKITMLGDGAALSLQASDHFAVGPIPQNLLVGSVLLAARAMGFVSEPDQASGLFERHIGVMELLRHAQSHIWGAEETRQFLRRRGTQGGETPLFNLSVTSPQSDVWRMEASLGGDKFGSQNIFVAGIECMEEREIGDRFDPLNQLMLHGDRSKALELVDQQIAAAPHSLYLWRRRVLMLLDGPDFQCPSHMPDLCALEPESLLFAALEVANQRRHNSGEMTLKAVSQLGEMLYAGIVGFDDLKSVEMVLAEVLGDAWVEIDPGKAEESYLSILERRGELPRILQKLVGVYQKIGDPVRELGVLRRALLIEKRRPQLSRIHQRISLILIEQKNWDQAIQEALSALAYEPVNIELARQIADLMVKQNEPRRALQILQDVGMHLAVGKERGKRAEVEIAAGDIWYTHLNRRDLAHDRFIKALEYCDGDPVLLHRIAEVMNRHDDAEGMAMVEEAAFEKCLRDGRQDALRRHLETLVHLYRDRLHSPEKVFSVYRRWATLYAMAPDEIGRVMEWDDASLDWQSFYQLLVKHLADFQEMSQMQAYHLQLGDVCRFKTMNMGAAATHYREALLLGWIEPAKFTFLEDFYLAQKDYAKLQDILKIRMDQVTGDDRIVLLEKLLAIPQGLPDYLKDVYSMQLAMLDPLREEVLRQRMMFYQMEGDVDRIERLISMMQAESVDSIFLHRWVDYAIELLSHIQTEEALQQIARYLAIVEPFISDGLAHHIRAIELLKATRHYELLAPHVKALLAASRIPVLPESRILEVLGPDFDLVRNYHVLAALQYSSPEEILRHGRLALDAQAMDPPTFWRMLCRIGRFGELTKKEFDLLRSLSGKNRDWQEYVDVLRKQLSFADSDSLREVLWREILAVARDRLQEESLVYEAFSAILRLTTDSAKVQFEMAEYAIQQEDAERALKYSLGCLYMDRCWDDEERMERIFAWLVDEASAQESIRRMLVPKVEELSAQKNLEKAAWIADLASRYGIVHNRLASISLEFHAGSGDFAEAFDAWRRLASLVPDERHAQKFLLDSSTLFERSSVPAYLDRMLENCVQHGFPPDLSLGVEHELKYFLAKRFFDREQKSELAIKLLQELYFNNSEDRRVWMPLYFLSKGTGAWQLCLNVLEVITREAADNPSILGTFPITLESLREELHALRRRFGRQSVASQQSSERVEARPLPTAAGDGMHPGPSPSTAAVRRPQLEVVPSQETTPPRGFMSAGYSQPSLQRPMGLAPPPGGGVFTNEPSQSIPKAVSQGGGAEAKLTPPANRGGTGQFTLPPDFADEIATKLLKNSDSPPHIPDSDFEPDGSGLTPEQGRSTSLDGGEPEFPPSEDVDPGSYHSTRGTPMDMEPPRTSDNGGGKLGMLGHQDSQLSQVNLYEWRQIIRGGRVVPGMTDMLMNLAFEHETEKHLAIQEMALFTGELEVLENWQFRVWRHPREYGYPRELQGRMGRNFAHPMINGHLHELIKFVTPVFVQLFQHEYSHEYLKRKLRIVKDEELAKRRRPMLWDHEFFVSNGISLYKETFIEHNMQCFDLKGLGREIYYDGTQRSFYLDTSYYRQKPSSFCFHRLMSVLRAVKMNYYIPLKMDPLKQAFPLAARLDSILKEKKITQVLSVMGLERDPIRNAVMQMDRDHLQRLLSKAQPLQAEFFAKLWKMMWNHLYSLQIAETLDLIGVVEAVRNVNLFDKSSTVVRRMVHESNQIRFLMTKGMELKV